MYFRLRKGVLASYFGIKVLVNVNVSCCLNACFLYSGHPLHDATYEPLQLAHFGFFASLFGHPFVKVALTADQTFLF